MSFDLGDLVPLSFTTTNAGAPEDAGNVTLTVTKPDGTPDDVTANIAHVAGSGVYTCQYAAAQEGHYLARWLATGANAGAFTDAFNVAQADPGQIISLAEARASLRIPAGMTLDDTDLRDLITAATGPMEDICGPILRRSCDEWHDGGRPTVLLLQAPIVSVVEVIESYGAGYTRTLTQQDLDAGSFDAFGFTTDLVEGSVTRRTSGVAAPFASGRRNVHVTYVAGRNPIPANILRATRRLVRWLWQSEMQGGQRPGGEVAYTETGFAVPNSVIQLCASERRVTGIG